MNQGLSVFIGMQMEQGSQEGDYHQQSHRVPRDQFSHKRILTKRSSKVNRRTDRTERVTRSQVKNSCLTRSLSAQIGSGAMSFGWR